MEKTKTHTPGPLDARIESVQEETFQNDGAADVFVNAPRALIQCYGKGQIEGLKVAAELAEIVEGFMGVMTMNKKHNPEQIWKLLDAWNIKARAAIRKAEGR